MGGQHRPADTDVFACEGKLLRLASQQRSLHKRVEGGGGAGVGGPTFHPSRRHGEELLGVGSSLGGSWLEAEAKCGPLLGLEVACLRKRVVVVGEVLQRR